MATYSSTKFIADTDGKIYLKSQCVSVYPSAYRGDNGAAPTPRVFDPEARLNTEKNIITHSFLSANKSYIIAVGNFGIKCIIGGYYFKLDLTAGDFGDGGDVCFANIKLTEVQLTTGTPETNTQILGSWINTNSNILDSVLAEDYVFSGIYFSSAADPNATASLAIATKAGVPLQPSGSIAYTEIQSAYNYLDTADNTKKTASITGNLVDGAAEIGGVKIDGAIAGIYKSAAGKYTPNLSSGESATALGINTVAGKDGELVVGKYNTIKNNTLFIVGNGTASDNRANAFTVYNTGDAEIARDLAITRNLETGGNTTLGNNVAEDLTTIKGRAVIDGKTGVNDLPLTIKNGSAVNFSVDSAGNISLSGDIKSSDNAFTIQSLNTNNKIAFDGNGSGNIIMQAGADGDGNIKLLSHTYFGTPGSSGVRGEKGSFGKNGSLFLYNRNWGSAKTTELQATDESTNITVILPDDDTTFIAGKYTDSATTYNSEVSVKDTLVKRTSEGNILTAFTTTSWSTLAIDGTLPDNVFGKTLEIGVMYKDDPHQQARYYNFGVITLRSLGSSNESEWLVGTVYNAIDAMYSLIITSNGVVYFKKGTTRISKDNHYKLHYRIIT